MSIVDLIIAFGIILIVLIVVWTIIELDLFNPKFPEDAPQAGWRLRSGGANGVAWYIRRNPYRSKYVEISLYHDFKSSVDLPWRAARKIFFNVDGEKW